MSSPIYNEVQEGRNEFDSVYPVQEFSRSKMYAYNEYMGTHKIYSGIPLYILCTHVYPRSAYTAKILREFTLVHSEKSVARKSKIVLLDPTVFAKREKKNTKLGVFRIIPYRNRRKRDLF